MKLIEQLLISYRVLSKAKCILELFSQEEMIYSSLSERQDKLGRYSTETGMRKATFEDIGDGVYFKVIGELPGTDNKFSIQYLYDISVN